MVYTPNFGEPPEEPPVLVTTYLSIVKKDKALVGLVIAP